MRPIKIMPLILPMLCLSCATPERALPDPNIPHQLSRPVVAHQWVGKPDGTKQEQAVTIPANWWIASPQVVEKPKPLGVSP